MSPPEPLNVVSGAPVDGNRKQASEHQLQPELNGWQIFFIALSASIGTGLFIFDGFALNAAGPIGYLIATLVVGAIAISFMDGLSEMIQVFPCTNALIHYVRVFVDEELATCVGWAYWASWSSLVAIQTASAAELMSSWIISTNQSLDLALRALVFYTICPAILFFINTRHIRVFGRIETAGGVIKLFFTVALGLALYYLAGQIEVVNHLQEYAEVVNGRSVPHSPLMSRETYLDQPFASWSGTKAAVCNIFAVISLVAFSWVGIDTVAVTAFEAHDLNALRLPPQRIAYTVLVVYLVFGIGAAMSVDPLNPKLAHLYTPGETPHPGNTTYAQSTSVLSNSSAIINIAAEQVGNGVLASVSNGFLIFSALSAANTCLYTASRTLYGLATAYEPPGGEKGYLQSKILDVSKKGVPLWAVAMSLAAFIWLPWLGLIGLHGGTVLTNTVNQTTPFAIRQYLNIAASTATIFVWGTQCLAFLCYHHWLKLNRDWLADSKNYQYRHLNRWDDAHKKAHTWLGKCQPWPARIGLCGCVLIVLIFPTAMWWGDPPQTSKGWAFDFFQVYTAPLLILFLWTILKLRKKKRKGKLWLRLEKDENALMAAIDDLEWHSQQHSSETKSQSTSQSTSDGSTNA